MIGRLISAVMCLLFIGKVCYAHDLGLAKVTLQKEESGQYLLRTKLPATVEPSIPIVPENCTIQLQSKKRSSSTDMTFDWIVSCPANQIDEKGSLILPWNREGAMVTAVDSSNKPFVSYFAAKKGNIILPLSIVDSGPGSMKQKAVDYLRLGIEHILSGIDHLLFVLGLLLLCKGLSSLVKTITSFTIGHSISLALASFGLLHIPVQPLEATIALSIVFLAAEIAREQQGKSSLTIRQPWLAAFGFGLLHGVAFAEVLALLNLPSLFLPKALFFFNVGVEVGQLFFVGCVLALFMVSRQITTIRVDRAKQVSVFLMGSVSVFWFLERLYVM